MAGKQVEMAVTVDDQASKEFKAIGEAAEKMGKDAETAGKNGGRSLDEMKKVATGVGAAIGLVGTAMSLAGREAYNYNTILSALTARYGEQTETIIKFADEIQNTTNFTNDQALKSAQIFGSLIENYGLTTQEIQQLISVSADLATASGISLEDAAIRVQSAIRGETESAEYLGLALNANTIDREGLMLTMTNEEAAHYRLNALMQQSAYALGLASEQQTGATGAIKDFTAGIQDQAVAFGDWLGPLGEVAAQLGPMAYMLPLVGAGLGRVAAGAKVAQTAVSGMAVAGVSLSSVLGPVGIAAAAGLAAVGLYKLWDSAEGIVDPVTIADTALGDLEETIRELYAAGSTLGQLGERGSEGIFPDLSKDVARADELVNAISQTNRVIGETGEATEQQQADLDRWSLELENLGDKYGLLDASMLGTTITQQDLADGMDDLNAIIRDQGAGAAQAQLETAELFDQFERGEISAEELLNDLDVIANSLGDYDKLATQASGSTANLTQEWEDAKQAVVETNQAYQNFLDLDAQQAGAAVADSFDVGFWDRKKTDAALAAMQDYLDLEQQIAGESFAGPVGERTNGWEQHRAAQSAANAEMQSYLDLEQQIAGQSFAAGPAVSGGQKETVQELASVFNEVGQLYKDVQAGIEDATEALDTGYRTIVENTNAWASSSQQVADWADKVIGAQGTAAAMDELMGKVNSTTGKALVTQEDYNAAQAAYTPIMEANQRVQDAVLAIQIRQAPILAELAERQADYVESVAALPAEQQLVTLGFMDTTLAAQAMQIQMLATSGASTDALNAVIGGAIAAQPILGEMLESMGLITMHEDGTFTLNVEGGDQLSELTQSINDLVSTEWIAMFGGDATAAEAAFELVTGHAVDWDGTETEASIGADTSPYDAAMDIVWADINMFGSTTSTATADVSDNATPVLGGILSLLQSIDGQTATTYVNTIYTGYGNPTTSSNQPMAMGGVVKGYAEGGVVAEMNEYGLEGLMFPDGSYGYTGGRRGLHSVPKGTLVTPASHIRAKGGGSQGLSVTINVGGSIVGVPDIAEAVSDEIIPAIIQAQNEWMAGFADQ